MKTLVLILHYNHPAAIARITQTMHGFGLDVLIMDDSSREECRPVLQVLVSGGIRILYRPINDGKGATVRAGLKCAGEHDYSHVLQVDADSQHHLNDMPKLLAAVEQNPETVICGWPQYGGDAPKARLYGRKITDFWNMLHTWSCDTKNDMCGFCLYPLTPTPSIVREETVGDYMGFDTETLIRLYWRGVKPAWTETPVQYVANGVSHFSTFADNARIGKICTRLLLGMLRRRLGTLFGKSRLKQ